MFYNNLKGHIEALLFVSGDPISTTRLGDILNVDKLNIEELICQLKSEMDNSDRGLTIIKVAGGYQLCTKPDLAPVLEKLAQVLENKLSAPALETLSIIAFRQPITKQEIENIRGVRVDRVLNRLVERTLIKEVGRKEVIGRPILYGTTEEFLKCFGLDDIADLPALPEIE
ncbi:MAG: chromosome segregation and condensation protein, ScpB [Firmicutes bacterium]|nr:chromosome segregation and condensation protein, ScpB [Bacillota bacterium]